MRILIAVGQDKIISGGAIQAIQLARELRDRGHRTLLVFAPPSDVYASARFEELMREDVPLSFVPMRGRGLLGGALALRRLLRQHDIQVLYAIKGNALSVALLAAIGSTIPIVAHRGVNYPLDFFGRLKYHHPRVRAIVAVSQATKEVVAEASARLGRKTEVVYQSAAECHFHPEDPGRLRRELEIPESVPVVAVAGNLIPRKGHQLFVECIPAILAEFPETRFVFIGGGSSERLLGSVDLASLGVVCTGFRTDVHELLPGVTVSVNPAIEGEGLTGTTRESLAAGVPVVVTDVAGTRELVEDGVSGFVVRRGDSRALGEMIKRLLRDPQMCRKMGRAGRERVEAIASPAVRVAAMERIFRRVIGSVRGAAPGAE